MSAKELNIGDYVRTKHYGVCRITDIYTKELIELDKINAFGIKGVSYSTENIIKSSANIIDLIEVGDYVNGYLVKDIDYAFDDVVMNNKNARYVPYIDNNKNSYIDDIKSIVTKEQFESMEYKIGE